MIPCVGGFGAGIRWRPFSAALITPNYKLAALLGALHGNSADCVAKWAWQQGFFFHGLCSFLFCTVSKFSTRMRAILSLILR